MSIYLLALLIGVITGLRTMVGPAAVSWAASLGILQVQNTALAFMGATIAPYIFTVLAIGELIGDMLPRTPSRTVPMQFGARVVSGAWCGATVGAAGGMLATGLVLGTVGAAIGTVGGAAIRSRIAIAFGRDLPAALLEDAVAIGGAFWLFAAFN